MTTDTNSTRKWSPYQQTLFDWGVNGKGSGIVDAVAGSGKTTAIEELCKRILVTHPELRMRYVVFNKRNADEATDRMPKNVEVSTFHSACMGPMRRRFGRISVDTDKVMNIYNAMGDPDMGDGTITLKEFTTFRGVIRRLVGLAKNSGVGLEGPSDASEWKDIIDHYGVALDIPPGATYDKAEERLIEIAQEVLERNNRITFKIDFDDMLYFTVLYDIEMPRYDIVCVDESQDTNTIQRIILGKMLKQDGRLIAVGDPRQAIYGFRGANADAMELIRTEFHAQTLQLSINYRCSAEVIKAAQVYCPQLEARPDAPVGSVVTLDAWRVEDFQRDDAILCRTSAPLITIAMRLIGKHISCVMLGRDIGQNLVQLVKKLQKQGARTIPDFEEALSRYEDNETERIMKRGRNAETLMQQLSDKVDSIRAFMGNLDDSADVDGLVREIEALFSDFAKTGAITLATIHKSKGLEWDRVFVLDRGKMPSKWAKLPWQVEQEMNLIYVAYTRARVDLRLVEAEVIA